MESKKINQLATNVAPVSTDLTIIGDPITGVSKKITLLQLASIFSGSIAFYTNYAAFPATGTVNTIYCAKDTNKLYLWSGSAYVETFPSQALLDTYQLRSEKGVSNGYASLDSAGKVPISQLPSSIMEYKGMWSATTNTPTLANGTGDTGDVYICNGAGSVNFGAGAITFAVGDYVVYSGTIWQRSSGAVGTVTSVGLSSATSGVTIGSSPITTSGTITLAIANATTSQNGLLTSTDWATFNGKFNLPSLTSGSVLFSNGTTIAQNNANFFWDNTNSRLGINTTTPGQPLDIHSTTNTLVQLNNTTTADSVIAFQNQNVTKWKIGNNYNAGANSFDIYNPVTSTTPLSISSTGAITLTANVTTTGAQFVQNGLLLSYANAGGYALTTNIWGRTNGINFSLGTTSGGAGFIFQTAASYDYTFPAATGTIALVGGSGVGTVTSVAALTLGTTGTDLSSTVANGTTTPVITLNVPTASATNRGALSSADWSTFNGKYNLPSLTSGSVLFSNGTTISQNNANFFWDNTNVRLGIGTASPSAGVTVYSTTAATQFKAAGTAPAFTFSDTLVSSTYACVFGLATSANHFVTGTAAGDMAIANQSTSAGAIVFGTGTTEKMRMTSTGKLSIGNTNDTYNLDVSGTIRGTTSAYFATTSGSVGIGTTNTNNVKLEVSATTIGGAEYSAFTTNQDGGVASKYSFWRTYGGGSTAFRAAYVANYNQDDSNSSANDQRLVFATKSGTAEPTTKMTITGAGNVGIGTTNPSELLEVSGATPRVRIISTTNSNNSGLILTTKNSSGTTQAGGLYYIPGTTPFLTLSGDNSSTHLNVTSAGNVGIGTSSPSTLLQINTAARTSGTNVNILTLSDTVTGVQTSGYGVRIVGTSNNGSAVSAIAFEADGGTNNDTAIAFYTQSTANALTRRLTILRNGQLQILQTANTYGDGLRFINTANNYWTIVTGGDNTLYTGYNSADKASLTSAGVWSTTGGGTSDKRKKQNIEYIETSCIDSIKMLKPVKFEFINNPEKTRRGFIAQDVLEVIPDLVLGDGELEGGTYGLDYDGILALAVKSIQEQQSQIQSLQEQINILAK